MRQIASEATTVRFRRIEVEGDAVLDARRTAQAVTAYVLSNQCDMKPHARDASPAIVPGFRSSATAMTTAATKISA